jgi:hypothetical protein
LLNPDMFPEVSTARTVIVFGPSPRQYTIVSPYPIAACSGSPLSYTSYMISDWGSVLSVD